MEKTKDSNPNLEKFIEENISTMKAEEFLQFYGKTPAEFIPVDLRIYLSYGENGALSENSPKTLNEWDKSFDRIKHKLAEKALEKRCEYIVGYETQLLSFGDTNIWLLGYIAGVGLKPRKKRIK